MKGKFVENGLEKKSKTDWTKMILKGKVLTQTKKIRKHLKKETRKNVVAGKKVSRYW